MELLGHIKAIGLPCTGWHEVASEILCKLPVNPVSEAVMAEWLRRWTRNPMGYSRAGSNPVHSEKQVLDVRISQSVLLGSQRSLYELWNYLNACLDLISKSAKPGNFHFQFARQFARQFAT